MDAQLPDLGAEWLETDGLGGFASGTVGGERTRRYHALLLVATRPPTGRVLLVNGFDAWVTTPEGRFAISSQRYPSSVVHPDGTRRLVDFEYEPWPCWRFRLDDGTELDQELLVCHGSPVVALRWQLRRSGAPARLELRPLLSGRDHHALHRENDSFRFDAAVDGQEVVWRPYADLPSIRALTNGEYRQDPDWYRSFLYTRELERGLDATEDLASPGTLHFDLAREEGVLILTTGAEACVVSGEPVDGRRPVVDLARHLRGAERIRRRRFASPLHKAADAFVVNREAGKTVVAGYPWFTDWGRDTFIAVRGLCLATGRLDLARDILMEWAGHVSEGMLPNRFPDGTDEPEFNSVDASLWYIVAIHDFLAMAQRRDEVVADDVLARLGAAVESILSGYSEGTRFGIRGTEDGLLAAGTAGTQLTWMDAKVDDWVVTPRIGKPVEVQALWLNALRIGSRFSPRWWKRYRDGVRAFTAQFWNDTSGFLHDVVDVDHESGRIDSSCRPNQIFAVGGLPFPIVEGERAERIVATVEAKLLTPLGLRSLAPDDPEYRPRYEGGVRERDGAYHQGTVWPWLLGPFVEAWVRVRGGSQAARREARRRFLGAVLEHLEVAGLGHVSEVADGEAPHEPRGCPFQAWSMGELLRLEYEVLSQ